MQDYSRNLNRLIGSVLSTIVAKVTNLQVDSSNEKQIKKLLGQIEELLPTIVTFLKKWPNDTTLLAMSLEEMSQFLERQKQQFKDDELYMGQPWWFQKAAQGVIDSGLHEGSIFDLDGILNDLAPTLFREGIPPEERQAVEKVFNKFLRVGERTATIGETKFLPRHVKDVLRQCKQKDFKSRKELFDFLEGKFPSLAELDTGPSYGGAVPTRRRHPRAAHDVFGLQGVLQG